LKRKIKILLITAGVLITPVLLSPLPRFKAPLSTVVEANDGTLLGARIADDGQWRFPPSDSVPARFEKALLTFEDSYFYYHPGINPVSVIRALITNIKAGKIVSGGSTLTMQVARLSRGNKPRTYPGKMIEILSAVKLEIFRSKKEILKMYVANAPFGGNTVGLEAASWRYRGIPSSDLSWAEAAAYAVLPNSPALVFPGKNQEKLKKRRDQLLHKMCDNHYIDSLTCSLALDEPLPGEPKPLPSKAPHLTDLFLKKKRGERILTTIDPSIQEKVTEIVNIHQKILANNLIYNSACIIEKVETGEVIAYVGNSSSNDSAGNGGDVDIIQSLRSTGSILKPILYAGMQFSGDILPNTLVPDIPTRFSGFSPKNFDQTYSGAVTAANALSQSLNIPSVRMLQKYNPERFLTLLKETGFTTFSKTADYYGLSLILGGGETSLWELCGVYASLSRILTRFNKEQKYSHSDFHPPVLIKNESRAQTDTGKTEIPLSAASVWLTYEALQKVNRPESESGWQYFSSSQNCAWKTGTSFGFRDAWAIGTTPEYVIAVWAGNADGEGRPGLTGVSAAAPVLFDILNYLRSEKWFVRPAEEMTTIKVCSESGYRAGPDCPETKEIWACVSGLKSENCPFHRIIHLNKAKTFRVTSSCVSPSSIINEPWFILTPAMEYFYKQKHPEYKTIPPSAPGCTDDKSIPVMEFIYPAHGVKIFIPRDQTGLLTRVIPEVAHRNPSKKIYWHLDNSYLATTRFIHQTELLAEPGIHRLTAVDEDGNSIKCSFEITGSLDSTAKH
jgi:penicillin-binding protein 1C